MSKPADDSAKVFSQYISSRNVMIVDPSKTSRNALFKIICEMGAVPDNVLKAESYTEAAQLLKGEKPQIVISEYDLDNRSGLELMQTFREQFPNTKDCLFALLTGNSSQSVVAQAAEEDIDTFILKPFTVGVLRQNLLKAVLSKVSPSDYLKSLEKGRKLLASKTYPEASAAFTEATGLDPRPALAYYYLGQVAFQEAKFPEAVTAFEKGLSINKIHYKCLVGLYETYMTQKSFSPAYEVAKKISRYFPASPKRLASVLKLAIMTKNYEDIERYYQLFKTIDQREDELIQYICAALVVTGKYYLRTNFQFRGLELYNNAAISAGGRTKFLREVVLGLCEFGYYKEATQHLTRFPPEMLNKTEYLSLNYLVQNFEQPSNKMIETGRVLINDQHFDPLIYKILIKRLTEAKQKNAAEDLFKDASTRFPNFKAAFEKAFIGAMKNVVTGE